MFLLLSQLDEEIQPTAAFGPPVPLEKPHMLTFVSGKIATWSVSFAASRWRAVTRNPQNTWKVWKNAVY